MLTLDTANKIIERSWKLKVWKAEENCYYVESSEGKLAYKCSINDHGTHCSCKDFEVRSNNDPGYSCKHLLAVRNFISTETTEAPKRPKLDERFIKQIEGKDFVLFAGILDIAHKMHLNSLQVELLQYPTQENNNTAVCRAVAKTSTGGVFMDIGDANPQNCNTKVAKHIIRMASTRAKARCLRDMTNIGLTSLEELGDINEVIGELEVPGKQTLPKKDNIRRLSNRQTKAATGVQSGADIIPSANVDNQLETKPVAKTITSRTSNGTSVDPKEIVAPVQASKPGNGNGKNKTAQISAAQKNAILYLSRRHKIPIDELENMSMKNFNQSVENLSSRDASSLIQTLQKAS